MNRSMEPLKLVHCSWATGLGAGVARMEAYYWRFLNRELFNPVFISLDDPNPHRKAYDSEMPYLYTGSEKRYQSLLDAFSTADIVHFQGSLDPLVCEAARVAEVPALVEVLHNCEMGGAFPHIDLSICVSEAVRSFQPDQSKACTVLNGIDLNDFPFRNTQTDSNRIVLLQVSNRKKPYFNLDELAEDILPLDPRIELWLAGPNQTGTSSERVRFLGLQENISALYQEADLMLLFSRMEPFGLAAIEAMASGCLPLVSNEGGFREIVSHNEDGFLATPGDRTSAISTIAEIIPQISSPNWARMQANARQTVETRFNAQRCVNQYESRYLELIDRKGRREKPTHKIAAPSPEAEVGDAILHSHKGRWDKVDEVLHRIVQSKGLFENYACMNAAMLFAQSSISRGNKTLGRDVFRMLYKSGFRSVKLFRFWLEGTCSNEDLSCLIEGMPQYLSEDPALLLDLLEKLLAEKRVNDANNILAKAMENEDQTQEEREVYFRLKEKLEKLLS